MSKQEGLIRFLSRHLVSLTFFDRSPARATEFFGAGRMMLVSGFVVSVRGVWFWITAGHVLEEIDAALSAGQQLEDWKLDDTFGWQATHSDPIPFDFNSSHRSHLYRDGMDYGVIALRRYYQNLLSANGVAPVGEEQWEKTWPDEFEEYAMLGFPSQLTREAAGQPGRAIKSVALLRVTEVDDPPDEMRVATPRFYGKVHLLPGEPTLDDIDGMSGAPIIAFKTDDKRLRYWLIAVQSGWHRPTQIIGACPIQDFVQGLAAGMDKLMDGQDL